MHWQQQIEDDEYSRWIAEGCPPIWGTHELNHDERAELEAWLNAQETNMPKIDDIYSGGTTLKASDLQGKARKVHIKSYEIREFEDNGKKSKKVILSFHGKEKGLVVNKTNAQIIAHNMGTDELDGWLEKEIIMYPTRVSFGDQMVDAIRVKEQIPEVAEGPDDDLNF
jgi:hypothetical protein